MENPTLATLFQDADERLKACEEQRLQIGMPTPQEIYWGGYADALCQAQGKLTRSNLDWLSEGVQRMFSKADVQKRLDAEIRACDACDLCKSRTQAVPGSGPLWTPLAIVGEGPGAQEDEQGMPFVGKSGNVLLGDGGLIPTIIGYKREHIAIRNTVCCRPPGNAAPNPEQIQSCSNYLRTSLLNIYPKVIVALGATPTSWFLGNDVVMGDVRGKLFQWEHMYVVPTYHPAHLLRNPSAKPAVEEDLRLVLKLLRG